MNDVTIIICNYNYERFLADVQTAVDDLRALLERALRPAS